MTHNIISFLTQVTKRDGSMQPFNIEKIASAILRAGQATGEYDAQVAQELTMQAALQRIYLPNHTAPHIEQIQDVVETLLFDAGYRRTLRAFIVYREQHKQLRNDHKTLIDVESSINEYLEQRDWRVNANANQGYSLGGLILNVSGKVIANYWLNHVYPPEVGEAHRNADMHIHDLDMLAGYCAGWSLRTLLTEGLNGVPGKIESSPPPNTCPAPSGKLLIFLELCKMNGLALRHSARLIPIWRRTSARTSSITATSNNTFKNLSTI